LYKCPAIDEYCTGYLQYPIQADLPESTASLL